MKNCCDKDGRCRTLETAGASDRNCKYYSSVHPRIKTGICKYHDWDGDDIDVCTCSKAIKEAQSIDTAIDARRK